MKFFVPALLYASVTSIELAAQVEQMMEEEVCSIIAEGKFNIPTQDENVPISCYTDNYQLTSYYSFYWEYWNCKKSCDEKCLAEVKEDGTNKTEADCEAEAEAGMKVACKNDFRVQDPLNVDGLAVCDKVCPEWRGSSDFMNFVELPYCEGAFDLRDLFRPATDE